MKKIISKRPFLTILFIALFFYCFIPFIAEASVKDAISGNLLNFNNNAQLPSNNNLVTIIIKIINTALSFLSLTFLVLIIYAGFLYLTSAGETKKVEKAQNILKDSVIGLAIIFFSYTIINFVFQQFDNIISAV